MTTFAQLSRTTFHGDGPRGILLFHPSRSEPSLERRIAAHGVLRGSYRIDLPVVSEPREPVERLSIIELPDGKAWHAAMREDGAADAPGLVVTPWRRSLRVMLPLALRARAFVGVDESIGAPVESLVGSSHNPTLDRFRAFEHGDHGGPTIMLNLLAYAQRATYPNESISGRRAYRRYGRVAVAHVASVGGTIEWMGDAPRDSEWDSVALVRYPSRRHFVRMVSRAHYQAALPHRDAALRATVLWAMSRR